MGSIISGIVIAAVIGFVVGCNFGYSPAKSVIDQCELSLPRDQSCELTATPEIKESSQ